MTINFYFTKKRTQLIATFFRVLLALILLLTPAFSDEKSLFKNQVIVEHAEVILPSAGSDVAKAFIVFWNGTSQAVNIVSIIGQSGEAKIVSDVYGNNGQLKTILSSMPRFIPPHSEFVMSKNGHYLNVPIDNELENASNYLLIVELDSGRRITASAQVLPKGSVPLDHHHGEDDR